MLHNKPVIERAFEFADSGRCRIPSEVRKALAKDGYTQADLIALEGKAIWAQLRQRCRAAVAKEPKLSVVG